MAVRGAQQWVAAALRDLQPPHDHSWRSSASNGLIGWDSASRLTPPCHTVCRVHDTYSDRSSWKISASAMSF
jgi:hypothetical protein